MPGKGGIFSSVGVAAGALVAAANAAFAQAADTSLPKLAGLTAVLHHGLRAVMMVMIAMITMIVKRWKL